MKITYTIHTKQQQHQQLTVTNVVLALKFLVVVHSMLRNHTPTQLNSTTRTYATDKTISLPKPTFTSPLFDSLSFEFFDYVQYILLTILSYSTNCQPFIANKLSSSIHHYEIFFCLHHLVAYARCRYR